MSKYRQEMSTKKVAMKGEILFEDTLKFSKLIMKNYSIQHFDC